ncbi:MAG: primosomal protein N' [Deltaproteobacteria bacterium CG11_big_fil_rev_8_21_14_0_20_42_23]|nr:MAG: primosomal protein N' [Deltaproteobacteria bacterium CG11_big_fil_rev_8_21_14_0_20_42_23]PJC64099.1 MAG: primosomal protein N' [Deltaproteobacteria bacterium CG_4_9_14_0_2_um_filter_42_21]
MRYADIAIPAKVFYAFTYLIPDAMQLSVGSLVEVPFRNKKMMGIVTKLHDETPLHFAKSLKHISTCISKNPLMHEALVNFVLWIAKYYCAPVGETFRTALPKRILEATDLNATRVTVPHELRSFKADSSLTLLPEQAEVVQTILQSINEEKKKPFLIEGITGSGKTEVYLQICEHILSNGGQAIFLVPEIGLTPQTASRVINRFGEQVAVYHSELTDAQRQAQWLRMKTGEANIAIGTRSALFAPFENLQAIIIDEEHDGSYKQEEGGVHYHARDAAVMRAHLENALIVLGSATPSLESYFNALNGKYHLLRLTKRATGAVLPKVELIDLKDKSHRKDEEALSLSTPLLNELGKTLARKEQAILFLNRRGFAHFILCEDCGHVYECPNCKISLTYHERKNHLLCHYCDYSISTPKTCASCKSENLTPVGAGTERLEGEIADLFPDARVARLDRDTLQKRETRTKIFKQMRNHEIDVLIGTQLITKGHDFPGVTLVGIISADAVLGLPDFRSSERTFQLITQVSGRAGRGDKPGKVIVQTYQPEHPSLLHAKEHNFVSFFEEERQSREDLFYPPFGRIANIKFLGNDEQKVIRASRFIADSLRKTFSHNEALSLLGPAPAPLEKIRGKFRWHILLKSKQTSLLSEVITQMQIHLMPKLPSGVRMNVDIDPMQLL